MGISKEQINYLSLFRDLGQVCLTESNCGTCLGKGCLVGYAKECGAHCRKNDVTYIQDGYHNIPYTDTKGGYDEVHTIEGISHILNQCRSCKENHYADCIINIIRCCYEIVLFGESQPYHGNALMYMMKLQEQYPKQAAMILEEYKKAKDNSND